MFTVASSASHVVKVRMMPWRSSWTINEAGCRPDSFVRVSRPSPAAAAVLCTIGALFERRQSSAAGTRFTHPPSPRPTARVVCTCAVPAGAGRANDRIRMPPRPGCKLGFAGAVLYPLQSDDLGKGSGLE